MKYLYSLVLVMCLLLPASAESASYFVKQAKAFDAAVAKASSWQDLHSRLSASSIRKLEALPAESRARAFKMMQFGAVMTASTPMALKDSKIGAEQASISLASKPKSKTEKGGGKSTMTMKSTVDFVKENGKWKIDLGQHLDKMK